MLERRCWCLLGCDGVGDKRDAVFIHGQGLECWEFGRGSGTLEFIKSGRDRSGSAAEFGEDLLS